MITRLGRLVLVPLLALAPLVILAPAPAAAEQCVTTGEPTDPELTGVPWAQRRLQPERVWPLTTGRGVLVAVIDSGIDARHPQLRGQVEAGRDFLGAPGGPSTADCSGHGTPVAGIIAARPVPGFGFHGVAPGARLLSIRQYEQTRGGETRGDVADLALAVREAVAAGARVINISATVTEDDPRLRAAVEHALTSDVVVVAAAGNDDPQTRPQDRAKAVYWPARYDGVLAVAASDKDDRRADQSHAGFYVDLAAPGRDVVSTGANGPRRLTVVTGTSFAAPFVAGTAALVRAYHPRLTAAQVAARITTTADVPAQGRGSADLGAGIVNPYAAVTAVIPAEAATATRPQPPAAAVVPPVPAAPDHRVRNVALAIAGAAGGVAVLVVTLAAVVPRGRERRWRPRRVRPSAPG